jgi:hypothetical protein
MTATVPARPLVGGPAHAAASGQAAVGRPADRNRRRRALSTPLTLRTLLAVLAVLSLAWGAFGGWVASQHSSAVSTLVAVDEPLSVDARQMYEAIADADVTITTAYLAGSQPLLTELDRYQGDIATASGDLAKLQSAGGDGAQTTALEAMDLGLPRYKSYVADAQVAYGLGHQLTGGSFLQVASEEAHLVLLPAANTVFAQRNDAVAAASGQATELPTVVAALVLALVTAVVLYRTQRWLTRRTNRVLSPGLAVASLLLVLSAVWLAGSFFAARSDLDRGIGQGSGPAEQLALASIGVQQIRGDAVLNVISRSGSASFSEDFKATSKQIGPGPGSLLTGAASAQGTTGTAASRVAAAAHEATSWYAANAGVYPLGTAGNYAGERDMVIGTGPASSAAGYAALRTDINGAINDDQDVFRSAANAGARELDPLEPLVIVASLLMALACGWGITRRLAEYR